MPSFAKIIAVLLLAVGVTACGPTYRTIHNYTPPPTVEGRMCVSQCQTIQNQCRANCQMQTELCQERVKAEARASYDRYVAAQTAAKEPIRRNVQSFEQPFQCSASSCTQACEEDFRVCYTTCGGHIQSSTVCTSGCDK